jgi:predicted GH43/DUF377 family glycosyl hydrolase
MKGRHRNVRLIRTRHKVLPDPRRVVIKPYLPGEEILVTGASRVERVLDRVMAIDEAEVSDILAEVMKAFASRHKRFDDILEESFERVARYLPANCQPSPTRRLLIGAYFIHEYSIEAAALFNPSMVPAPDQSGLGASDKRFIMSLRGVGEGHISSIEFRSGVVDQHGNVTFDPVSPYLLPGRRAAPMYDKRRFQDKLLELHADNDVSRAILEALPAAFSLEQLEDTLRRIAEMGFPPAMSFETQKIVHMYASSNYVMTFPSESVLSERLLFPAGPTESRGMEDARFVRFQDDDKSVVYYATYTAFDGFQILPQLIETSDFISFRIATLAGKAAQNKGMALFPRRVSGSYMAITRHDRENLHLIRSDDVRRWHEGAQLAVPTAPWELIQIGNCGSPIETKEGWLVLTHGVGPVRRYAIGAMLLDLDEPERIRGQLREPLLAPAEHEREGYVPNVVYSCGGMIHQGQLILPYGFSDQGVVIALVPLDELLAAMM